MLGILSKPELGELKNGRHLGHKGSERYAWASCKQCGKERWVRLLHQKPISHICNECRTKQFSTFNRSREHNPNWIGGKRRDKGYWVIRLYPDDFFWSMVKNSGYVYEHRLVMAKSLGRCLQSWEIVHHKNHIRDDNRIENLQLISDNRHKQITILETKIKYLESKVSLLEEQLKARYNNG